MVKVRIVERNGCKDRLGEGLYWSARENAVFWTDILGQALNRLSLKDGSVSRWDLYDMLGWVIEREDVPGFIAGFRRGFAELTFDADKPTWIDNPDLDLAGKRLNDAKADSAGRIWAGTMPLAGDKPTGGLFCFGPDRRLKQVDGGYHIANGPALSPCERWLYHSDSALREVYRFTLTDEGELANKCLFLRFEQSWGLPDGMTCDADGGLWIAHWGGARVSRFTADARLDRSIEFPATQITNVCFAGSGLDRMFVTSASDGLENEVAAGCLFEVDPGFRGLPTHRFRG